MVATFPQAPWLALIHTATTYTLSMNWVVQQLRQATQFGRQPRYLFRDNDGIYGHGVSAFLKPCGIREVRAAYRSPWQNGTVERLVGSVRRELLDHVIVFNEEHLRRLLREYVDYYNDERVHTSISDAPAGRPVKSRPSECAKVVGLPRVGGLHHRYCWHEAA